MASNLPPPPPVDRSGNRRARPAEPFDPAESPALEPQRCFVLSAELAARFAARAAIFGDVPADVLADLITSFLDEGDVVEEGEA